VRGFAGETPLAGKAYVLKPNPQGIDIYIRRPPRMAAADETGRTADARAEAEHAFEA